MKSELRLYDEAHSRNKCIDKEYFKKLENDLKIYAEGKKERSCETTRQALIKCLRDAKEISHCTDKIDKFVVCVNQQIKKAFE